MVKVRLDFLKYMGGNLTDGDGIWCSSNGELIITEPILYLVNSGGFDCKGVEISNFTERKNKGIQPVPDGFPVVVTFKDGRIPGCKSSLAKDVDWENNYWYARWKPDYDKLLEMQKKHDAKQEKPIEELMINAKESKMSNVFTQEMKDRGVTASIGMEVKVLNKDGFEIEYGDRVIGQSVKVLSEPLPVSGSIRVQAVEFMGQCYCFRSSMLHPIKSKEELDLEEAKDKQVKDVATLLNSIHCEIVDSYSTTYKHYMREAEALQEKGMLAEIVLPLEGK